MIEALECTKCGEEKPATPEFFTRTKVTRRGVTQPCRECHKARMRVDNPRRYASNRAAALLRTYRSNDRKAGRETTITAIELAAIIARPCFYCGDEDMPRGLDRVDNAQGHVAGNVVACCQICNKTRNDHFTHAEMVLLGPAIAAIKKARL